MINENLALNLQDLGGDFSLDILVKIRRVIFLTFP